METRYTKRDKDGAFIEVEDDEAALFLQSDWRYIYRIRGEAIERFAELEDKDAGTDDNI